MTGLVTHTFVLEEPNLLVIVLDRRQGVYHKTAQSKVTRAFVQGRDTSHKRRGENGQPVFSCSSIVVAIAMPWGDSAPVDTPDLAIVGTSTAVEVLLALVALRFVANRRWPAYIAKNCGLVPYTALAVSRP